MFETYLLYLSMAIITPIWLYFIKKDNKPFAYWGSLLIPLLFCSIIIGGRYYVGTDWINYFEYINDFNNGRLSFSDISSTVLEPGYMAFTWLLSTLGFGPSMYFLSIGLLLFVLLLVSEKEKRYLHPFLIFFFFALAFANSMNIVRQFLAIYIFIFSTRYYDRNRWVMALLLLISISFHYSSTILLLALIIDKKWFSSLDNRTIILSLFIITYFTGHLLVPYLEILMPEEYFSDKYLESLSNITGEMVVSSGLGIIATKIMDIILILLSTTVKSVFNDTRTKYIYRLYFVGILLSNIAGISQYLSRLFSGFVMLRILVLAYTCFVVINITDKYKIVGYSLIMLGLLFLTMSITNGNGGCSPYHFLWM